MEEPEILKAAKEMMVALRNLRDNAQLRWDNLLQSDAELGGKLTNAWDRMKTAIITTEREILSPRTDLNQ